MHWVEAVVLACILAFLLPIIIFVLSILSGFI
jgi:hypothetical protein